MSEMKELEAETKKQAQIQKLESVGKYLDGLLENCKTTTYWMIRGDLLEFFALIGYSSSESLSHG